MLKLKNITKDYPAGAGVVHALRGIDLEFRKNEFVTILGPSGCGKTTLLNIVGGLDRYTEGDLTIRNKSTKDFNDRDWDTYRNHSIGFVFQSYNLIPHQTVLQNVEIALTVAGVNKAERRKRATLVLEQVGLGDQLNKRPNQISGGQMQRVAIARALVNDPDIILADEPTGALDTETSTQVMEILKEISQDRLIIMVTHNAELAGKYASRIIRMLDGRITDDSLPPGADEKDEQPGLPPRAKGAVKQPSMSFATAFMLSLKNLFTKKGRTMLTAFAGSIGIMGIALILAVSQGMTQYIQAVQEDALSSYPLSIQETTVDMSVLMETFMNVHNSKTEHDTDAVYKKTAIYDIMSAMNNMEESENDLQSFKAFLDSEYEDDEEGKLSQAVTGIQYSYDLGLLVYTKNVDGEIIKSDTEGLMRQLIAKHLGRNVASPGSGGGDGSPFRGLASMRDTMGSMGGSMSLVPTQLWQEMLAGKNGEPINEVLKKQYDLVYGSWPGAYDEVVLVLDKNNELDDLSLYALGLLPKSHVEQIVEAALEGTELEKTDPVWSYEEICSSEYRVILNSSSFSYDEKSGLYLDLRQTDAGLRYLYDDALRLSVTGIIRPNADAQSTMLQGAVAYTKDLTEYVVQRSQDSPIIAAQIENSSVDVLTGLPFKANTGNLTPEEKALELAEYLGRLDEGGKAGAYVDIMSIPAEEEVVSAVEKTMAGYSRPDMESALQKAITEEMGVAEETVADYIANMSDEEMNELFAASVAEMYRNRYAAETKARLGRLRPAQLAALLEKDLETYTAEESALYYDTIMEFSEQSYESNLAEMGYVDLSSPKTVNIFASSFSNKEVIEAAIKDYNEDLPELSQIKYTDYLGIMMRSITTIINAITYVLLAFVAISLVVSSIMIGVITLISVQERTKEIGILRAIGASKADVSGMFNAETVIIGFVSGLLGVGVTYLLCIPINHILHRATGISNLNAFLPPLAALVLVLISMGLSLVAGLIPSRSAAKKDPVVALRTE